MLASAAGFLADHRGAVLSGSDLNENALQCQVGPVVEFGTRFSRGCWPSSRAIGSSVLTKNRKLATPLMRCFSIYTFSITDENGKQSVISIC